MTTTQETILRDAENLYENIRKSIMGSGAVSHDKISQNISRDLKFALIPQVGYTAKSVVDAFGGNWNAMANSSELVPIANGTYGTILGCIIDPEKFAIEEDIEKEEFVIDASNSALHSVFAHVALTHLRKTVGGDGLADCAWIPKTFGVLFANEKFALTYTYVFVFVDTKFTSTTLETIFKGGVEPKFPENYPIQNTWFGKEGGTTAQYINDLVPQMCGCLAKLASVCEFNHNNLLPACMYIIPSQKKYNITIGTRGSTVRNYTITAEQYGLILGGLERCSLFWEYDGGPSGRRHKIRLGTYRSIFTRYIEKLFEVSETDTDIFTKIGNFLKRDPDGIVSSHNSRARSRIFDHSYDIWMLLQHLNTRGSNHAYMSDAIEKCFDLEYTMHGAIIGSTSAVTAIYPNDQLPLLTVAQTITKYYTWIAVPRWQPIIRPEDLISRLIDKEDKVEASVRMLTKDQLFEVTRSKPSVVIEDVDGFNRTAILKYLNSGDFSAPNFASMAPVTKIENIIAGLNGEAFISKGSQGSIYRAITKSGVRMALKVPNIVIKHLSEKGDGTTSVAPAQEISMGGIVDSDKTQVIQLEDGSIHVKSLPTLNEILATLKCSELYENGTSMNFVKVNEVYNYNGEWIVLMELIDGTLADLTDKFIPRIQHRWMDINTERISKGLSSIPIPSRLQIQRNVLTQVMFALHTYQTSLRGMHTDFHWKNVFLKYCDETLYRGKQLFEYERFEYTIKDETTGEDHFFSIPNIGIIAKIGDLGFANMEFSREIKTPLQTAWSNVGSGNRMVLSALYEEKLADEAMDKVISRVKSYSKVFADELSILGMDVLTKYASSLRMRRGRRYDATFDCACLLLGLGSRKEWFRVPIVKSHDLLEYREHEKSGTLKTEFEKHRINKNILEMLSGEKPTFYIPTNIKSKVTPFMIIMSPENDIKIYMNTNPQNVGCTYHRQQFNRVDHRCVRCWQAAQYKCPACNTEYCGFRCAKLDSELHAIGCKY